MKIRIKKFTHRAKIPTQATPGSAEFDHYFAEERILAPRLSNLIRTGVGFQIPPSYFRKIYARSSCAERFTGVGGKVIDSAYKGDVLVIFFNYSDDWFQVHEGENLHK